MHFCFLELSVLVASHYCNCHQFAVVFFSPLSSFFFIIFVCFHGVETCTCAVADTLSPPGVTVCHVEFNFSSVSVIFYFLNFPPSTAGYNGGGQFLSTL